MEIHIRHNRPALLYVTGKWKSIDKYFDFYVIQKNKKIKVLPTDEVRETLLNLTVWNDNKTGIYINEEDALVYKLTITSEPELIVKKIDEDITLLTIKK